MKEEVRHTFDRAVQRISRPLRYAWKKCPHGFENCNRYRFRYNQMPSGAIVTWERGTLEDRLTMRLEQCMFDIEEARSLCQQFIEHGRYIEELWSETLQKTVRLTSRKELAEYLDGLRETKYDLEGLLQVSLSNIMRRPGKSSVGIGSRSTDFFVRL
jgi:hypothetical protein